VSLERRRNAIRARAEASIRDFERCGLEETEFGGPIVPGPAIRPPRLNRHTFSRRRLVTGVAFATLFFAGAAISAGAGGKVVDLVTGCTGTDGTTTEATTSGETTTAEADAAASEPAGTDTDRSEDPARVSTEKCADDPAPRAQSPNQPGAPAPAASSGPRTPSPPPAPPASPASPASPAQAPAAGSGSAAAPGPAAAADGPAAGAAPPSPPAHAGRPPRGSSASSNAPRPAPPPELETDDGGVPTIWLHRILPDPTPRAKRLSPAFARQLRRVSAQAGVHWALVLGVLRARDVDSRVQASHERVPASLGRVPASRAELEALANDLAALNANDRPRRAVRALSGQRSFTQRAIALWRYNRAVRLRTLVVGLGAATPRLEKRVLEDKRVDIYAGGRADIEEGRINVRVLALMLYLAEAHGQVTVSSLESGHRLYARPGVISAHVYGLAVDISGLRKESIFGNQEPGGLTEKAVRNILLLPAELQPQQVISLLGLGGPSFPLADHGDHIHVGY
jgi:hypothetical protein